ncbi:MAG TPA: L,D-transpeptidase [Candidatus Krumholzibacteria bacterium]|nr:L,D-transpeptidase [Candidatus Krumholzibacteria bacterium]HPD72916.1 L,D-transpeptidase [Candidatus Krumholzibacteria bacterium]HRY41715.1 L,D-transpeptidase [Candidatus Krumholzibacteria bacterium]
MKARRLWLRWLTGSLIFGVVVAAGVVGYFMYAPPPLPELAVLRARQAYLAAQLAPPLAPAELARADSLKTTMETLYAAENARLVRFRPNLELERTANLLAVVAATAETTAMTRRDAQLHDSRIRREELTERLRAMRSLVETQPGAKTLRVAYNRAEVALGAVRKMERQGSLRSLAAQLDSASAAVARAETLLDRRTVRLYDPVLRRNWQTWVDEAVAGSSTRKPAIVVDKLRRRCVVVRNGKVVAQYRAEFGRNGLVDKLHAGDGATPEGQYRVSRKNQGSRFYRALLLDYPNAADLAEYERARRQGRIRSGIGPGGLIEIHGHGGRNTDWTDGCVALRDQDIEHLFKLVEVGTPVTIVGTARLPGD